MQKETLWRISGDDFVLISDCSGLTQHTFKFVGIVVLVICGTCFLSSWYTFTMLLNNQFLVIPLAGVYSMVVFSFYRLLLCTLTKNMLPYKKKASTTVATGCRVAFVLLIAMFVSKPIEVLLCDYWLQPRVSAYREELVKEHQKHLDAYYRFEEQSLTNDLSKQNQAGIANELISERLNALKQKKMDSMNNIASLIDKSSFFIYRLTILNQSAPLSWIFTLLMIGLFLTPAFKKYRIPSDGEYYTRKTEIERKLIESSYSQFMTDYSHKLATRYELSAAWNSHYVDPPFNTERIVNKIDTASEQDLLAHIYRRGI